MQNDFEIHPNEIHLWWASLDVGERQISHLRELLDEGELQRANRFRVPHAARRFICARAALRIVLGRATETDPSRVGFAFGDQGKPFLPDGGPHFNASDSSDIAVIGVAFQEIGVDVEIERPVPRRDRLARRICTDRELSQLASFPETERDSALLRLWTFKEAGLKAVGTGLPGGLRNVEFEFGPGAPPRLRHLREHNDGWELLTADIGLGLMCSLVVAGTNHRLVTRELEIQSV